MNYAHAYHAGNVADVLKHVALIEVLDALRAKPKPFCAVDTHAGDGVYRLEPPGEFERGIGRLWPKRQALPALDAYLAAVAALNPDGRLSRYPGSPWLIRHYLRPGDRAVLTELHPGAHGRLKAELGADPMVAVHAMDAWQALKAFVPPAENRGLVLIDPPYEQPDELARIAAALKAALKHWRNGTYLVWYPIKTRAPLAGWHRTLAALGVEGLVAELLTLPEDVPQRLNGSGMVILNPPWRLRERLASLLDALARALRADGETPRAQVAALAPRD